MTVHGPGVRWLPTALAERPLVSLGLLAAALLLWNLGGHGLWESTEARYAEVAARMLESGDWLTPRLNFIVHFEKPPLTYWMTALGMQALGMNEAGARIGLVAAALVTLAIVFRWASEAGGSGAGVYAALALLSAPLFFGLSRSITTDLYLTLSVVSAAYAARRGTRPGGDRRWRLAAWAALGAGFMAKGPVVLLWTMLPMLAWTAWTGSWERLRRLLEPSGVLLGAAIALPWFLVEVARYPGLLEFWLGGQTVGRVVRPFEGEVEPWWFYAPTVAWAGWLWILPAVAELWRRRAERPYALAWVVAPLLVFSLLPTKRANYLLPLLPVLAIAAGTWWADAADRARGRVLAQGLAVMTALVGIGLLGATFRIEAPPPLPALGSFLGPAFLLGGIAAWMAAGRGRFDLAFAGCLVPVLGLYVAGFTALGRPSVEPYFKISRPLARVAAEYHRPGDPIVGFHDWPRAFPFYLGERITTVTEDGRKTRFETDERWRQFVFTDEQAVARYADAPGALFYLPRDRRARLEALLGHRVEPLAATHRHLLARNPNPPLSDGRPSAAASPDRRAP